MKQKELLNRIDKNVAVACEKIDSQQREMTEHKHDDREHKKKEETWQASIEEKLAICPELDRIEKQGENIRDISITVKAVRLIAALILLIGTLFGIWFAFIGKASGDNIKPNEAPYVYQEEIEREVVLKDLVYKLNHGFGAQSMGVHFRCSNITSETPTLQMTALNHCLLCKSCEIYTRRILIHIQTIAFGWFKWSGSQEMEIYNRNGMLILLMDNEGSLSVADDIKVLADKGVY